MSIKLVAGGQEMGSAWLNMVGGSVFFAVDPQSISSSSLRPVVTFLNHGILPFVGREGDCERIVAFWRATVGEPSPGALLVSAEAGMGKSRLADEILRRVEQESGAAIHLRFYPDSSLSLAPLLSQALRLSIERQQLSMGDGDQSSTILLLRRLTHLRPTVLILEDIHLLTGNPLRELQEMLQGTADLPLAIVFLTRPVEIPVRGVIEPLLVAEFQLQGLAEVDVRKLLSEIFALSGTDWLAETLHATTLGNPLAVRSALRAAVTSGALRLGPDGMWKIALDQEQFTASLRRGVHLLTEGMVAHLSAGERGSAELLAELGEVFALSTARRVIGDAESVVRSLLFRGILSPLDLPISPLVGKQPPGETLAFSHTLLHRHLLGKATLPRNAVVAALAEGLPFYSANAIEALTRNAEVLTDSSLARSGIEALVEAVHFIDGTTDWKIGPRLLEVADSLFEAHRPVWDTQTALEVELPLLQRHIAILRREEGSDLFNRMLGRLLDATDGALPAGLREYRLAALRQKHLLQLRSGEISLGEGWQEVESLIREQEDLRFTVYYLLYLRFVVDRTMIDENMVMARAVEKRFAEIEATGRLDEGLQRFARNEILAKLLWVIESPEELERRLAFLAEMDSGPDRENPRFAYRKILLLLVVGRVGELLEVLDEWIPRFDALGLWRNAIQCRMLSICEPAAFGEDLSEITRKAEELVTSAPEPLLKGTRSAAYTSLTSKGALLGEPRKAREIATRFFVENRVMEFELLLVLAYAAEDDSEVRSLLNDEGIQTRSEFIGHASHTLASLLYGTTEIDIRRAIDEAEMELRLPILRLRDLHRTHAILESAARLCDAGHRQIEQELLPAIRQGMEIAMTWLEAQGLNGYMLPFITHHRRWWTRRQAESWQARMQQVALLRKSRQSAQPRSERLRLRMLGAIEARRPDGVVVPIRGGRLRVLAGLLVADRLLSRPLAHREFCRIASGEEDPERARKTMNGAVMRLRELLGEEAITTEGETPGLNLSLLSVDLLDVVRLCRDAVEAMRSGLLSRALTEIRQALDIWNGDVPFPTLYDSFFEAAREDFENRLSTTATTVARALLAEDDPAGAGEILRRAAVVMPGDDTIAQLLIEALERSGYKADAERVRLAGELDASSL